MMSDAEIATLARRFIESLGDFESDEAASMLAPDAVYQCRIRSESLPLRKEISGHELCTELRPLMKEIFPAGVRHEVKSVMVSGNRAAVETEGYGESVSGGIYNNYYAFIIEFSDGLVKVVKEYTDFLHTKEIVFPS